MALNYAVRVTESTHGPMPQPLQANMFITGAFAGALVIMAFAGLFMVDEPFAMPDPALLILVPIAVAAVTIPLAELQIRRFPVAEPGVQAEEVYPRFNSVQILRLALIESIGIISFVTGIIVNSWPVIAIGVVISVIALLALVFPHRGVLRRYEARLNSNGANIRLG